MLDRAEGDFCRVARAFLLIVAAAMLLGCDETLLHDLDEIQANEVVATLQIAGIAASKTSTGREAFGVVVPRPDLAASVKVLASAGLPRQPARTVSELAGPTLVRSPLLERELVLEARAAELSASLMLLPEVVDVSIRVAPRRIDAPATALAIFLWNGEAPPLSDEEVASKIAAGFPDLQAEHVTVESRRLVTPKVPLTLVSVGPLLVASEHQARAWGLLTALAFTSALFPGSWLLWWARKRRRQRTT